MGLPFNIGSLFQDKDLENLVNRIDTVTDTLYQNSKKEKTDDLSNVALSEVLNVIKDSDSNETNNNQNEIQQLLERITIQSDRLGRYRSYNEIHSSVQLLKRIITVYTNNVRVT